MIRVGWNPVGKISGPAYVQITCWPEPLQVQSVEYGAEYEWKENPFGRSSTTVMGLLADPWPTFDI